MRTEEKTLGSRVADFVVDRPLISVTLVVALTAICWAGLPRIVTNFTHTAFFYDDDPMLLGFNQFERQFGNDDAVTLVVHSPSGIFDKDSAELMRDITTDLWKVPEVIHVESLSNFSWVHAQGDDIIVEPLFPDFDEITEPLLEKRKSIALGHEILPDYLISKDGTVGLLFARLKPGFARPPDNQVVIDSTRKVIKKYKRTDHEFFITGGPAINNAFKESSEKDMQTLIPIVLLLVVLFLALSLRTVGGTLMPFLVIVTTVSATFALAGWLGLEVNAITAIIPQVLIAIGVADSVHILTSFIQARRRGDEKREAARYALTNNFVPTILTSVSTSIGFFAFFTANLKPISGLGVLAGLGTLYAWFVTYFLLGPLISRAPSFVKQKTERTAYEPTAQAYAVADMLYARRAPIFALFAVLCAGAIGLATQNVVNSDPFKYFAEGYPLRDAQDFVLEHLGGVPSFETVVTAGEEGGIKNPEFLAKVERLEQKAVVELDGINRAVSLIDILRQTNRSLNRGDEAFYKLPTDRETIAQEKFLYEMSLPQGRDINDRVTVKNDALRISFVSTISDSNTWMNTAKKIESIAEDLGLDAHVTGKTLLYQSTNSYVVSSFITSLSIATVLISILLIVFFRSFRIGGIALLPNMIPLVFGGAILNLLGAPLDVGTMLVCSVCLGIAVDDTIHVMANFNRHMQEGRDPRSATAMVVTHTWPALMTTTLVLAAGFGILAFGTFVPNINFGVMSAVVLVTALITDLVFLPALLMTFHSTPHGQEVNREGQPPVVASPSHGL